MKVGLVGLGQMGSGIAGRLLGAGVDLTVFNRSSEKMLPVIAQGARAAHSLADFAEVDVVLNMLADDQAVETMVLGDGGLLQSLHPATAHLSCSTISVALSAKLAAAHADAGQEYISAPVFGRPEAAAEGKLFLAVGGQEAVIDRLRPLLSVIGQRIFVVAPEPDKANLVKLCGNFLIASLIESLGEAMALAEKGGVDRHAYLELMTSSLFDVPVYKNYGAMIAERKFTPPGFAAPLGQKDIRLLLAAAEALDVSLPFASILRDRFITLAARGGETRDWSALGALASSDAGLFTKL